VESEAAFLAAVHNAHWWQSSDLVEYYCAQAVEFSPKIAGAMDHFIDLQTRRTPMLMCRSAEQISALGSPLIQHYLLRYNNQQLDQVLLGAVVKALKKTGVDAQVHLDRLRREEHSVTGNEINLLEYYYCSAGLQPQEVVWVLPKRDRFVRKENHYYRAYWRESRFVFVGEANSPVRLQITCRLPAKTEVEGSVRFTLNGGDLGEIAAGQRWKTWDISVAGGQVRDGLNEISVQWPLRQFPGREGYEGVMDDLLEGNIPEFFFVFGEIHAFTASGGRKAKELAPAMQPEYSVIGAP
jgi:hypothetical protein